MKNHCYAFVVFDNFYRVTMRKCVHIGMVYGKY